MSSDAEQKAKESSTVGFCLLLCPVMVQVLTGVW